MKNGKKSLKKSISEKDKLWKRKTPCAILIKKDDLVEMVRVVNKPNATNKTEPTAESPVSDENAAETEIPKGKSLVPVDTALAEVKQQQLALPDNFRLVGDVFYWNTFDNCIYWRNNATGEMLLFTNTHIMICGVTVNEGKGYAYLMDIFIGRGDLQVEIPVNEYHTGQWLRYIPGAQFNDYIVDQDFLIPRYLRFAESRMPKNISIIHRTARPGWKLLRDGWRYITPDGAICGDINVCSAVGQRLLGLNLREPGMEDDLFKLMSVTPDSYQAAICLLYTVLGLISTFNEHIGLQYNSILFICDYSRVYEHKMAEALTLFDRDFKCAADMDNADIRRWIAANCDAVMLVENVETVKDKDRAKRISDNLSLLANCYGKTAVKPFTTEVMPYANDFPKSYGANGTLVCVGKRSKETDEVLKDALYMEVQEQDVNIDTLNEVINNPLILNCFMGGFIQYLSCEAESAMMIFKEFYAGHKKNHRLGLSAKLRETEARLEAAAFLLVHCLVGTMDFDEGNRVFSKLCGCIESFVDDNAMLEYENNYILQICRAIVYSIEEGDYPLIDYSVKTDGMDEIILVDDDAYYIEQETIWKMKEKQDKNSSYHTTGMSSTAIAQVLFENGVIDKVLTGGTERFAKTYPGHGKTRYIKVKKNQLHRFLKECENN